MARGYSQSRSEGPGYSEGSDRKSKPRSEYPPETEDYKYKNALKADFMALARTKSGDEGKAMSFMDDKQMSDLVKTVAEATSDARSQLDDFDRTVEDATKALDAGIIDFGSYSQASEVLPLTFSEIQNGDDPFELISDAVEEERPDDIEGFIRDFVQQRVDDASANRQDYNDEIETQREDAIGKVTSDFLDPIRKELDDEENRGNRN
jgi:hypothetical protein